MQVMVGGYMKLLPAAAERSCVRQMIPQGERWKFRVPNGKQKLPGVGHSFFSSLGHSNRKCCSGLFAKDPGGTRSSRRRSSAPQASTI
jgi:hypothetical protein